MSPYRIHTYPKWADILVRVLRLLQYGSSVLAGAAIILVPSPSINITAHTMNSVLGIVLLVAGLLCLVGAALQRWVWEWVSLFFVTGAIGVYSVVICSGAFTNPTRLAGAGAILMLFFLLATRAVDLTVYWVKNVRTARIKQVMEE